jgi:quinoprotein glucose dehydrogenase
MNAIKKLILLSLVAAAPVRAADYQLFAHTNLVAWCIVPFDTKKRGPEARGQMLEQLGIKKLAYDWRGEHIPTFDAEVAAMNRHGVEMTAWWFPGGLNAEARAILACIKRNDIHPQLWVVLEGGTHLRWDKAFESTPAAQAAHVERMVAGVKPIAAEAAKLGCQVALYNHGGWFGVPENQIQIIERLKRDGIDNVGMVYTQHHGHGEIDRFSELFPKMKPHLLAITLNGMIKDGDLRSHELGTAPLGQGDQDLRLLRIIKESGWSGPVGIILEVNADAEARLQDNLDGLDWLVPQLDGKPPGPRPLPRSWKNSAAPRAAAAPATTPGGASVSAAFGNALRGGMQVAGRAEFRRRPLTVECWAKLDSAASFNILVASDTKESAEHWELYSYAESGVLSLYQPGRGGEFKSEVNVCDSKWHYLAAVIEPERVRLFVDGKLVKDAPATPLQGEPSPGDLAFGQLVEGGLGCDGVVDNVRISRGARKISGVPAGPLPKDAATLGRWDFEVKTAATGKVDYWAVESAAARAALPEFRIIPAALPGELTPANGFPKRETFRTWHRSHGDNSGERYSALDQINRQNVTNLQEAWTYHSKDGAANIQCNPVVAEGVMFAPTAGEHIVAVNAATGTELWRFKPGGHPAHRGLIYWPGEASETPRLFFMAGNYLYALDVKTGQRIGSFGKDSRTPLPGSATAGPAIFQHIIVVPGFERDVWGLDLFSGKLLWTFHTVPHAGEFGYDTWDQPVSYAANCWGGMALDEVRGIAYVTTGSPKDNFIGVDHRGDNLFANCVIAIDARTGKRLWHFQEIHHDIWDLDLAAPPNLTTITRNGCRVDIVAATTKIGNTLLLDRVTGKPVFPYRERRAPASNLPGEQTSPYQPDVEWPEPFARVEFKPGDLTDRSEESAKFVAGRFKGTTVGFFQPCSEGKSNLFFGIHGGANWPGACVDPESGRLFVSANHIPWLISVVRNENPADDPKAPRTRGQEVFGIRCAHCHEMDRLGIGMTDEALINLIRKGTNSMPAQPEISELDLKALVDFLMLRDRPLRPAPPKAERPRYRYNGYPKFLDHEGYPGNKPPWGTLNCLDLNSGKLLWKVPLGEYPELTREGVPKTGTENFGGAIVTAGGLVFCSGTRDSRIRAFDKDTGAELWSAKLPWVGSAPPACYEVKGRQFIVIAATGGGKLGTPMGDAYVAFALPPANP